MEPNTKNKIRLFSSSSTTQVITNQEWKDKKVIVGNWTPQQI